MSKLSFYLLLSYLMCIPAVKQYAQPQSLEIEGVYLQEGTPIGLSVKKLQDGNFLFQQVLIKKNGELNPFEWQSAYVLSSPKNTYLFYWHTGRYEDIPGTNKLIVYDLKIEGNYLSGVYYFPVEPKTPPARVRFQRERQNRR